VRPPGTARHPAAASSQAGRHVARLNQDEKGSMTRPAAAARPSGAGVTA